MKRYTRHLITSSGRTDIDSTCNAVTGVIWMYRQVFKYKRELLAVEICPVGEEAFFSLERFN